jgi:hypothetical protein
VRGVDGTSRYIDRLHFVPDPFQVSEYSVEAHVSDARRVFKQAPSGEALFTHAESLIPEPPVIRFASLLPGATRRLAWDSTCE